MADKQEWPEEFEDEWARIVADLTSGPDAVDNPPGEQSEGEGQVVGEGSPGSRRSDPRAGTSEVPEGLASLFEPLRRAEPVPEASFVDNWSDEGHYTPPPPPEIPEGTPLSRLAWAGTLGGPAVLIGMALTGWDAPPIVGIGAGLAFLAGFATLVWRMPESREDGWDDGARL